MTLTPARKFSRREIFCFQISDYRPRLVRMLRILHLDDSLSDRELTEAALGSQGIKHELCWASNKTMFVALLDRIQFDVVLSDSGGPSFEGKEALALVRRRQPEAAFIFLTGHSKGPFFDALMQSGADGVLSKEDLAVIGETILRTVRAGRSRHCRGIEN